MLPPPTPAEARPAPARRRAGTEPLPGYRLVAPLGQGGFGEVWRCEAPGGLLKAIKFVRGSDNVLADDKAFEQELRSLRLVSSVRHPFLVAMDRVDVVGGGLAVVMELADRSLHDVLVKCKLKGAPGLPREELVGYLREAAEALDWLNFEYGLQHLDVKPRNLLLFGGHVKAGDFGLVTPVSGPQGGALAPGRSGAVTPLYAAPETFLGKVTRACDQYSLALSYHELLTGVLPFAGKNARQLALQHLHTAPDLHRLPKADREAVARALAKEPDDRFPSCTDFVRALHKPKAAPLPPSDHDHVADGAAALAKDLGLRPAAGPALRPASRRRAAERFRFRQTVWVAAVSASGETGPEVSAEGRDISRHGLSFLLPERPPLGILSLRFAPGAAGGSAVTLRAHVARVEKCADGRYLVGVRFAGGTPRRPTPSSGPASTPIPGP
jgi:hypothetical protein